MRNVTDIDDKIIAKAAEQNRPWWSIGYENERAFNDGYDALGCLPPTYEPRATGHITEMIEMMRGLIERGHAYEADGNVYFDVRSFPGYLQLSNQELDDLRQPVRARARPASATRATSPCGRRPSPASRAGRRRGAAAVPAGTWSARRWRTSTSAPPSTSTAAAST